MARKSKILETTLTVPALKPTDTDVNMLGFEPEWTVQPEAHARKLQIVRALNWYSRFFDSRVAKTQLQDYLAARATTQSPKDSVKNIANVSENHVNSSICWLARMSLRGLELSDKETTMITTEVDRLIAITAATKQKKTTDATTAAAADKDVKATTTNIQEVMRGKARLAAGNIEGMFDDFISAGYRTDDCKPAVLAALADQSLLPHHVTEIITQWTARMAEFNKIAEDRELAEGYKHLTRTQIKAAVKFCEAVIADLKTYITVKRANRAPRKRRAVSPEKQASKLKYLRTHDEFKLTSVAPAKIIGANEVWAYDTAKRKLWYFVADQHAGSLSIKGSTILGFDSTASGMKTLRRPQEQLQEFMSAGKPAARKFFKDIKSVQALLNGRTNENLVILKVY